MVSGPYPLPPADLARGYQALHDRAIFGLRQRMMQGGINYAQGALGLLQSFRPGGSAALEAGVYQNLSGMMFQRAAMTQPLDLMSDLRRHEAAIAQQNANRARERQTYVQIGQAIATLAGGYLGGVGGAAVGGILGGVASGIMNNSGASGGSAQSSQAVMEPYRGASMPGGGTGFMDDTNPYLTPGQQGNPQQPQQQQQVAPLQSQGMGPGAQQQQQQPSAMQSQLDVPGAGAQGQMQQQQQMQQQRQMGGAAGGMGGGIGAGMPTPGADGNFTGQSFAAASAMGSAQSGASPVERLVMTNYVADLREADPFFRTLGFTINSMWANTMRLTA